MAFYRVAFSREWAMGRWGFIDRMFHQMGGRPSDAAGLENTWLVPYHAGPGALGKLLSDRLYVTPKDFSRFGIIFDIQPLSDDAASSRRTRRPRVEQTIRRP